MNRISLARRLALLTLGIGLGGLAAAQGQQQLVAICSTDQTWCGP